MTRSIVVRDACEHNLRHVDVTIPRDAIVVVTGVSGSGKSSLAFDTVFEEGQRRYVDSLSAYARQFIGVMKRPDVQSVTGISPTISIDQKTVNRNPRSTVGTTVEILDFLRLLFARLGVPHCPRCGKMIQAQTVDQIVDGLYAECAGRQMTILAPIVQERKGEYRKELADLAEKGFGRVRVDGEIFRTNEVPLLVRYEKHTIEVVVDRLAIENRNVSRIREDLETALRLTEGKRVAFLFEDGEYRLQGTELACVDCGISIPELEPRLFSFNDTHGQCPHCKGLGRDYVFAPELMVPDESLSIHGGALKCQKSDGKIIFTDFGWRELGKLAKAEGFSLDTPWKDLPARAKNAVFYGSEKAGLEGIVPQMQALWERWHIAHFRKFMHESDCPVCHGTRLSPVANAVTFRDLSIDQMCQMPVEKLEAFFRELKLSPKEERIGHELFKEIRNRLNFLVSVGLGYLTLARGARTLSGGEAQRIRLASAVGAGLQGVLYVLDEPSIGLHARDNEMLLGILERLRSQGNSLLVVEHDEETMRYADYVIDVGPEAGVNGGRVVAAGTVEDLERNPESLTGKYLSGKRQIEIPQERKPVTERTHFLEIFGAAENNLKHVDVRIPLDGTFTVVTGVSGSGKSSLVDSILKKELARIFYGATDAPGKSESIAGTEFIDKVIEIDQTPIGRTPRSNPATYTGIFDDIRDLFAKLPESKVRGYTKSRFSFNVSGGRCECCEGAGVKIVQMQILPDVAVPCDVCGGKRFNESTLEVHYKGKTITDVLEMSVDEACEFFADLPKIAEPIKVLQEVGLGYLKLGQPSTTLSGGEAQRVKIATELRRPGTGKTLYLLDEPTTGLHFEDIRRLLDCLKRLRKLGNSMLIIEHNMDVIKCADWLIDLGPDAGERGGQIVAVGTPEDVAKNPDSITGKFLAKVLFQKTETAKAVTRQKEDSQNLDIRIAGARKHNLKHFSVTIPRHQLTVISGVSGSGKSSLAFHTLFAEGQRRFVETLSTYARRFLGRLDRGSVDYIQGLSPAIAIDQGCASKSPRSTVATLTEIYDYFRILWARIGDSHCPHCGRALEFSPVSAIMEELFSKAKKKTVTIFAPIFIAGSRGEWMASDAQKVPLLSSRLQELGYRKLWIDGKEKDLPLKALPSKVREVYAIVDRVPVSEANAPRLNEALERAYHDGMNVLGFRIDSGKLVLKSLFPGCPHCHYYLKQEFDPKQFSFNTHWGACETCSGLGVLSSGKVCPDCHGERLKPEILAVTVGEKNISQASALGIHEAREWFAKLRLDKNREKVARPLLREILGRLAFLENVGLGYLNLNRAGDTLSGGESQRIRLASQIGSGLEGVMYVLDEPTVGLHQSDTKKLLDSLYKLRDLGNTLIVVEHDLEMIRGADHLIDMGPQAGEFGGEVVAEGSPKELSKKSALKKFPQSETVKYLSGKVPMYNPPLSPLSADAAFLEFRNLQAHNLKNISVRFPENRISVVCGVSGSGKSSLVLDEVLPLMQAAFGRGERRRAARSRASFPDSIKEVLAVDQSPISGTPRSTPASFTDVLNPIRDLFAKMEMSKMKGFKSNRFSYNCGAGRCEACEGRGLISVEMHFLSDVWEVCDVCHGKRYNQETLAVEFKGKNIADVLDMRIDEACEFFKDIPKIVKKLQVLLDVGLGYLRLGQSVTTLSGGEAQRMKLAAELSRGNGKKGVLYLLDEPTTGLHLKDIQILWNLLRRLSARGNTIIIIEHHPDIIRLSDWVVELGPSGGKDGGFVTYMGSSADKT